MVQSTAPPPVVLRRLADALCRRFGLTLKDYRHFIDAAVADGLLPRRGVTVAAARLRALAEEQRELRKERDLRRARPPVPLAHRLAHVKEARFAETRRVFLEHVRRAGFRTARAGDHTNRVLDARTGAPTAEATSEPGERYSSRCTYRRTDSTHTFRIHRDWRARVADRGLASVHGAQLVLDAVPLPPAGDVELYRVTWVEQGRGFGLNVHHGYVAVAGGTFASASTSAPHARAEATRRMNRYLENALC